MAKQRSRGPAVSVTSEGEAVDPSAFAVLGNAMMAELLAAGATLDEITQLASGANQEMVFSEAEAAELETEASGGFVFDEEEAAALEREAIVAPGSGIAAPTAALATAKGPLLAGDLPSGARGAVTDQRLDIGEVMTSETADGSRSAASRLGVDAKKLGANGPDGEMAPITDALSLGADESVVREAGAPTDPHGSSKQTTSGSLTATTSSLGGGLKQTTDEVRSSTRTYDHGDGQTETLTDEKKSSSSIGGTASADWKQEKVSLGLTASSTEAWSMESEPGHVGEGHSESTKTDVAANLVLDGNEGGTGGKLGGDLTVTRNGHGGKVHAEVEQGWSKPVQRDGKWVVTYREGGKGGGGYTGSKQGAAGGLGEGGAVSAELGVSGSGYETYEKAFATEEEAAHFLENAPADPQGMDELDVDAMAVGDSAGEEDNWGVNAGVGASFAGTGGGLTGRYANDDRIRVTKQSESEIIVEITATETVGGGLSLATTGLGMGVDGAIQSGTFTRVSFTDRAAFDAFMDSGELDRDAPGVTVLAEGTSDVETQVTNANLMGLTFTEAQTTSSEEYEDADGNRVEKDTGTNATGLNGFGYENNESHSVQITQLNDGEQLTTLSSAISSSSKHDTGNMLSDVCGGKNPAFGDEGDDSGKWKVSSSLSDQQLGNFVRWMTGSDYDGSSLLGASDDADALRAELKDAAGDVDAQRAAITEFVSETGAAGLAFLRRGGNRGPGEAVRIDLELEGDPYWTGARGRLDNESKLERFRARVASGDVDMGLWKEIDTFRAWLQEKCEALDDGERYEEVPDTLRQDERIRTGRMRHEMAALAESVWAMVTEEAPAEVEAGEAEQEPEDEAMPPWLRTQIADVRTELDDLDMLVEEVEKTYAEVQLSYEVHYEGKGGRSFHAKYGGDWFVQYALAASFQGLGEARREEGLGHRRDAEERFRSLDMNGVTMARGFASLATDSLYDAWDDLANAEDVYQGIRRANSEYVWFWQGYGSR